MNMGQPAPSQPKRWILWTFVLIFLLPALCSGAVCNQSGWFGKDSCQYKCHCTNDVQCDSTTGECPGRCSKGWFGPQCQYVDLTTTQSTISTPTWLSDGKDNICNTDTNVQTVTIQLKDPLPVTWLRLYVNNPENVGAFTVTFKTKTGGNTVTCNNMKTGSVNDKTLDIYCDLSVAVQEVILTGDGVKSLCSVYISGGRNVALKQSASQSTIWQPAYGAAKAVDGNTDGNLGSGSCTHTTPNADTDPQWSVTFPLPQTINRYVLYNRRDAVPERLQNFILSSFDATGSEVFQYQDPLQYSQPVYTITSMNSSSIEKIKIKATHLEPAGSPPVLTLCEVEAYGDTTCEDGKYGRECEQSCVHCLNNRCFASTGWCINGCEGGYFGYRCDEQCSPNCRNNICDPSTKRCTGGCKDGFYGSFCEQGCSNNCNGGVCAQNDGTCSMGCKNGYTGFQCGTVCSTNCKDDVCKQDTGDCQQGCDLGFYGSKCENACSLNCVDNRCEQSSGTCSKGCKDGYNGTTCENACPSTMYGKNCSQTCSTNCTGQKCNHVSGKCDLCIPGKRGDKCDQVCQDHQYGQNCSQTCSTNCKDQECNKVSGICFGCIDGKTGNQCKQACSVNCVGKICDQHSRTCLNGCNDGYNGSTCENACPHPTYGKNCAQTCSKNCKDQKCNHINGKCDLCLPGKTGDQCDEVCPHTSYGQNCSKTCSVNCKDQECNKVNGTCFECQDGKTGDMCNQDCNENCKNNLCDQHSGRCSLGCNDGFTDLKCDTECPHPTYGPECTQTCSINCTHQKCNNVDGKCDLCVPGTLGNMCNQECKHPSYGQNCSETCSTKCVNQVCNKNNGTCDRCPAGWTGDQCDQVCPNKTYGDGCKETCSTFCINEVCDPVNGTCDDCVPGKLGDKCDQNCSDTTYGIDCNSTCSIKCKDQLCDTVTGNCTECYPGKKGYSCEEECETGKYGRGCQSICSVNCRVSKSQADHSTCNNTDGTCLFGCVDGFNELNCSVAAVRQEASTPTGAIVGAVIAIIVIAVLIVLAALLWRRRRNKKGDATSLLPWNRSTAARTDSSSTNSEPQRNGRPSPYENYNIAMTPIPVVASAPSGPEETAVSAARNGNPPVTPRQDAQESNDVQSQSQAGGGVYYNEVNANASVSATAIAVKDLDNFIRTHPKQFFQGQFSEIPDNKSATTHIGLSAENKKKNRYKNICAYDHSRVKLQVSEDKNQGDYINASHIEGYMKGEMFIAAQGATKVMVNDFIRMLWEQGVEQVVMLANLVEEGKQKCERYWPEACNTDPGEMQMGEIKVVLATVEVFADYTIRRLKLEKPGEEERLVTQYHFTSWPDKGVPTTPWGLVDFQQRVASQPTKKPVVVHCSAGVGRTGTFISLRNVMRQAEDTGYVDFFTTVQKLRHDRINMVQTSDQYEFLHKAAQVALLCLGTTVTSADIQERIEKLAATSTSGMSNMEKEFNTICQACADDEENEKPEEATKKGKSKGKTAYENSDQALNKLKDRCQDVPAKDCYKVTLTGESYEAGAYINAVFVPSFRKLDHQILTQLPLPTTVNDFWRMVTQYKVSLVVAFETNMKANDSTIGDYLPVSEDQPLVLPMFQLTTGPVTYDRACEVQSIKVSADGTKKKRKSTHVDGEHSVVHVKCDIENYEPKTLLTAAKQLRSLNLGTEGRTVYMCRNGATYSGLVCVLTLLLDRMDHDLCLTVPLVVGATKSIRPQVIPTLEQYKVLYQVLQRYSEIKNSYTNFGDSFKRPSSAQQMSLARSDGPNNGKVTIYANI